MTALLAMAATLARRARRHLVGAGGTTGGAAARSVAALPARRLFPAPGNLSTTSAMVVLNRIYTRTGDKGTTALGTGKRVSKTHPRIEAYGSVDETNAAVGLARLHTAGLAELDRMLERIQNELFDVGADLCMPTSRRGATDAPRDRRAGGAAGERNRPAQRRPEALALLRAAGRPSGGGPSPSLPDRVPARRAGDRGACRSGAAKRSAAKCSCT